MKTVYLFFAASRYWQDTAMLNETYKELCMDIAENSCCRLVVDGDTQNLPEGDCLVAVPMSGAVQKNILEAASHYESTILYGAYIRGNASSEACNEMLRCNAAPTLMDVWAVLHRTKQRTFLCLNKEELRKRVHIVEAYFKIRGATVLKIGQTEPWVISNADDASVYEERFGIKILCIPQEELALLYREATRKQAEPYYVHFKTSSTGCKEPDDDDLWNASRMAWALVTVMKRYEADAAALACFNLLKEGTNSCLGVSYVNDCTDMIVSCEGDVDSAVTMLLMKQLTSMKLWMANPGLQPDDTVNFSHCTSPICCMGKKLPCILRNHHESGIGVSLQVDIPTGIPVTACRISDNASKITVNSGTSIPGEYENACRTQMHVRFEDMKHYIMTALGCHQVFAFEDISEDVKELAGLFGLEVL